MASLVEVKVPDIGDFKGVEVIEVLVKAGDTVAKEQSLISLESDKATMEIPSPEAGVVRKIVVKLGDKVSQGSVILTLEPGEKSTSRDEKPQAAAPAPVQSGAGFDCDMLVLGSGPGGYSAAFRAADLGLKTVLVERYPVLGGVCLNVGCIPSKALLHTAAVMDAARELASHGIEFGAPQVDLDKLRAFKGKVVGKLTSGLAAMAKMRKVTVVEGLGSFVDSHRLLVKTKQGDKTFSFKHAIIAAGSQAAKLPFLPADPRIVDSTGALELRSRAKKMLVIGGGIIGLEMGTVYSTLGARLDVVEMLDGLMQGADRDLVAVWQKMNAPRFDHVLLQTKTAKAEAVPEGIRIWFEGERAPKEPQVYDMVLVSVGRTPNGRKIGAENAGVAVDERGSIPVDSQMRTNVSHIYAIGDIA
ncbi:MAG: FAD-dependent oxidoreductase, partial [Betaproteobacteria bacterium]|nr:FAD-dependent oxidoreductase [Betaproteobacteria bacterium]